MQESKKENQRHIAFSPPDITEAEIESVAEAMRSGWITTGPRVKALERRIQEWLGAAGAVCLNSQTAAAETALRLLEIGPGDEVITCAYTYTASASVIAHVGARIRLVDCQRGSYAIDYDALEAAINERTKAIIPIDLGGIPCDYDRLLEIVERKKGLFSPSGRLQEALGRVAICADAAHAFGSSWHGQMLGSIADFTAFSFHAVKNFTTAEGGALTWHSIPGISDEEIYHQTQLLSLHGQSKDALSKSRLGAWEYDIVGPWYKCNMTDIQAAMGLVQLDRYPYLLARRKQINQRYDEAFATLPIETMPHYREDYSSTGHLYLTRVAGISDEERREIIVQMAEAGIACNVHYKPLPMHTAYRKMGFDIKDFPMSYARYANVISLPNHTLLSEEDQDYVIDNFLRIVRGHLKERSL